ncbi:MAG: hypothetical protein AAB540_00595, partial [Patescibacteria group bacterium]
LRLEKHLKDKPILREAIRTEGMHKVALVAKLATAETENIWVDKLKNMSKSSLFELAKEVRGKVENGKCQDSFCKAVPQKVKIDLEGDLLFMFLKLKKKYGNNLSNNEVMKKVLESAMDLLEAKPQVDIQANVATQSSYQKIQIFPGKTFNRYEVGTMEHGVPEKITKKAPRYVQVKIKKSALSSTNGKCSYPGCEKPAEIIHHPERFAKSQNHNNIKPLCKIHHEFMHNGLVKNEQSSVDNWQLDLDGKLDKIDMMYREYRRVWAES